jgi:hypothetical protein
MTVLSRTLTHVHRDDIHSTKSAHKIDMESDPIIDRSPAQKRARMEVLRVELAELGYSVVTTAWLQSMMDIVDFYTGSKTHLDAAE